jgi:hypothetical protein
MRSSHKDKGFVSGREFFIYIFSGLECVVGHCFAYVAHFVFLRDVWIEPRELP